MDQLVSPIESLSSDEGSNPEKLDLFLSYNSLDRDIIVQIRQQLESRHIRTFLDRELLTPGVSWFDELQTAISNVKAVAVFLGKNEPGAWQKREMQLALDHQAREERAGRYFPVVPVLLPGASLDKATGFLLLNSWIDLRSGIDNEASLLPFVKMIHEKGTASAQSRSSSLCPYRGLRTFREEDAPLFFGRELFAQELLRLTLERRLVTVVGASGSGKSSLIRAGLIPLLRRQHPPENVWDFVLFAPGKRPFHNLAAALIPIWETDSSETQRLIQAESLGTRLATGQVSIEGALSLALKKSHGTDRLLIIVDQFEELFTQTPPKECERFIDSLLKAAAATKPITVMVALRADFYGQAISSSRRLSDGVQGGVFNLGPMKTDELRRTIVEPARQVGLELEAGLVKRILSQVQQQPGNLPLLEFALTELWTRRQDRRLTNEQYDAIGELPGAISQRAEAEFARLSHQQQDSLLRALTRLVRFASATEEGRDTRQRVSLNDLDEGERFAVAQFVNARLLVMNRDEATDETTVELAHESLIQFWWRFRDLLDKNRTFFLWRQRLDARLREWQEAERDAELLLRGNSLLEAKAKLKNQRHSLNSDEAEFIRASEQAARQSWRWVTTAAAACLVIAMVSIGVLLWTRSDTYQIRSIHSEARRLTPPAGSSSSDEWVAALVFAGFDYEAFLIANNAGSPEAKFDALIAIARALTKMGKLNEAKKTAFDCFTVSVEIEDSKKQAKAVSHIAKILIGAGEARNFLEVTHKLEKLELKANVLLAISESLLTGADGELAQQTINDALQVARQIKEPDTQADLLLRIAEMCSETKIAKTALATAEESLNIARDINDKSTKALTLGRVANVLFKNGDHSRGKEIANEALLITRDSKDIAYQSLNLMGIAEPLIRAGNAQEALNIANNVEYPVVKYTILPLILSSLVETVMIQEAIAAASKMEEPAMQHWAYYWVAINLATQGKIDAALNTVRKISDPDLQDYSLGMLAFALAVDNDKHEQALAIAGMVKNPEANPFANCATAIAMAKSKRTDDALVALRKTAPMEFRAAVLIPVLNELRKYEAPGRIKKILDEHLAAIEEIASEDMRCSMLAMFGSSYAMLHDYRTGRKLVEQCSRPELKLSVYSSILMDYTKRRSPNLAKVIDEYDQEVEEAIDSPSGP